MKTIFNKFLVLSGLALLMLSACKKDGILITSNGGKPGALTASTTTLVLNKAQLNDTTSVIRFNITPADYGFSAAVTNTLQIDSAGDNWAKPTTFVLSAKNYSKGFNTGDFNAMLLKLNLPPGKAAQVLVRAAQSISSQITPNYSNVITLTATPFNLASYLWVPGAYEGWNPSASATLVSPTSNNIYSGIINFAGSDLNFKVTSDPDWNHTNYGAGATAGTISSTGGNLLAPAAGGLLVNVNLTANTITFTPQWSIIGDATPGGWGGDTNMLYNAATDTWYLTANLTGGGNIKFRFKNSWTINLGGSGGTLSQNGANIPVAVTGTYAITLNANANTYTLVKQ